MKFRRALKQKPSNLYDRGILDLFFQDLENQIIPYDFYRNPICHIFLHGETDKVSQVVNFLRPIAGERHSHRGNELKSVVAGAIDTIGKELIRNGIANYKLSNDRTALTPNYYDNNVIKYLGLFFSKNSYGERFSREGFEYTHLSNKEVWSIVLPRSICSYSYHKSLLSFLSSQKLGMPDDVFANGNRSSFNVKEFSDLNTVSTIKSSEPWGWDGRKSLGDDLSEYYRLVLSIRQTRALSLLREHILRELSMYLEKLGIVVRLRVYGLLEADDLNKLLVDLERGDTTFKEAYEFKSSGIRSQPNS